MAVYAILRASDADVIQNALDATYSGKHLKIGEGEWLVSSTGPAQEVWQRLDAATPADKTIQAMVFRVSSYWGLANSEIWDWIYDHLEPSNGS